MCNCFPPPPSSLSRPPFSSGSDFSFFFLFARCYRGSAERRYSHAAHTHTPLPDSPGGPEHTSGTYISLDCVSGRLLDKDHNMTLFLFCAGSVNRRKSSCSSAGPLSRILITDLKKNLRPSQACSGERRKKEKRKIILRFSLSERL